MAESSKSSEMVETEIAALKEVILTQQKLLQKLYIELDDEREASGTAVSEALSMILRLQGEKAAVKMESSQYKRMAEEKIYHAEESLADFEELMYQKEMEIASLEFQVSAYRCKLLSMGSSDMGIGEKRFPDHLLLKGAYFGDMGVHETVRRNNSLPAILYKNSYFKKDIPESERSSIPLPEFSPRKIDKGTNREFNVRSEEMQVVEESADGEFSLYWKQMKQSDEQVKELSHNKDVDRGDNSDWVSSNQAIQSINVGYAAASCSLHSQASRDLSHDPTRGDMETNLDPGGTFSCSSSQEHPVNLLETETLRNTSHSTSVHDIFEVPQIHENHKCCGPQKKEQKKLILEGENSHRKPGSVPQETVEFYVKDEADWLKKMLLYEHQEEKNSKPEDGVQQLNTRLELLEDDRRIRKKEAVNRGEEEIKLLREIHEQLNEIQSELSSKNKKSPPLDDSPLVSVMEAMLVFWL